MKNTYILITPARNEEKYLRATIDNILQQTVLPTRWVIIDDASTDSSPDILKEYSEKHPFISNVRLDRDPVRNYGSRVNAVLAGYQSLRDVHSEFVGILDADISLPLDYYESIIAKFDEDEKLGVAGGLVLDVENGNLDRHRLKSLEHVPGGVQMFRRDCYEAIGGYMNLQWGGDDFAAEATARMLGWRTQSFPEIEVLHNRTTMSEEERDTIFRKVRIGFIEYSVGYFWLYHTLKCISKIAEKPFFLSAILRQFGYVMAAIKLGQPSLPLELARFVKNEQAAKIGNKIMRFYGKSI
ncbi:MAG: glycosyltransferase family 2 protein [Desulfatirhabdiaceae bacterium]